jgi:PPP family 3-phenylpropionic acid transporter
MPPAVALAFFYAAIFAVVGVQLPFWPVWMAGRGLEPGEIGTVIAASLWVKVAANPLAGLAADRGLGRRRLIVLLASATLVAWACFVPARGFVALLVTTVLASAVWSPILPLGENLAIATAYALKLDYGKLRLWGSLSFIVAALGAGRLVAATSSEAALALVLGLGALMLLACFLLPGAAEKGRQRPPSGAWRQLLQDPRFLLFLGTATCAQASHSVYYGFASLHWTGLGYSPDLVAALWAEGVVAEILLFWASGPLVARLGPVGLLALGCGAAALRWMGTAFAESLQMLVLLQSLHAFTFGAAHLGAMHFIQREVPASLSATAQAIYAAFVVGIGFGLTTIGSGSLYSRVGPTAYLAMAAMGAAGLLLAAALARRGRER